MDHAQGLRQWFERIAAVPHTSHHEAALAEMIIAHAREKDFVVQQDRANNVLIRVAPSLGYEQRPGLILQAHLDMVAAKTTDSHHDFLRDPLKLYEADGFLRAEGTSLGADNGIGVAAALAVLDGEMPHPALAVLLTVGEEVGMFGARALSPDFLPFDRMLNLDAEEEDRLYIGCAGGVDMNAELQWATQKAKGLELCLCLKGLKSGHSGLEIHLPRGNAHHILAATLLDLQAFSWRLLSWQGSHTRNVIPAHAELRLLLPAEERQAFEAYWHDYEARFKALWQADEPEAQWQVSWGDVVQENVFQKEDSDRLLRCLVNLPPALLRMSAECEDVPETSYNFAGVHAEHGKIELGFLLRSLCDERKEQLRQVLEQHLKKLGAHVSFAADYPAWREDRNSSFIRQIKSLLPERRFALMHAGLECGVLKAIKPDLQMISLGPDLRYAHTPRECVQLDSLTRLMASLNRLLRELQ